MRKLLNGMQNIDNFIDDIIIFTPDLDQHLEVLRELLLKLRDANLTTKQSKCSLCYSSLECLRQIVGEDRLKTNPDKVRAIQEASRQETKRHLRSVLGLVSFYRKFVTVITTNRSDKVRCAKQGKLGKTTGKCFQFS